MMNFKEELALKILKVEYGISSEQIDNLAKGIRQIINELANNLAPLIEIINDVIEELNKTVNEILECQQELEIIPLTKEQAIKYVVNKYVEEIYKRKEPP